MRPLAAVLIARYQLARGRRDEAIATLTDRSEPWHAPAQLLVELDRLDAVDALAGTQDRLAWHELGPVARGLARRRRFDLLRPMLERPFAPPAQCGHLVWGALAGLWAAPATPDDTVLVRDWLLPVTVGAPHTRSECAQLLALVGDHVMARAIVDELREQRSITDGERIDQHTIVAPVLAALGDTHEASSLLAIALDLWAQLYVTSADRQGDTRRDALARAQARVRHLVRLAEHRALPWIGRGTVPTTFTSYEGDEHRAHYQTWADAVEYAIDAHDLPALFAAFDEACERDIDHSPLVLADIAERLPRSWITRDLATGLAHAAYALGDPRRPDGGAAVVGALAEAGHLDAARTVLPRIESIYLDPGVYARLGAHLVTRDRAEARRLIDRALTGSGPELDLAKVVDADLRAGR